MSVLTDHDHYQWLLSSVVIKDIYFFSTYLWWLWLTCYISAHAISWRTKIPIPSVSDIRVKGYHCAHVAYSCRCRSLRFQNSSRYIENIPNLCSYLRHLIKDLNSKCASFMWLTRTIVSVRVVLLRYFPHMSVIWINKHFDFDFDFDFDSGGHLKHTICQFWVVESLKSDYTSTVNRHSPGIFTFVGLFSKIYDLHST